MSDIRRSLNNIDDIAFAVKRTVRRNEKLEADNKRLRLEVRYSNYVADVATEKAKELEAKLAKAMLALDEAIYLLDPDEEDIAKETGLYRIVTTYAELKGGKDDRNP